MCTHILACLFLMNLTWKPNFVYKFKVHWKARVIYRAIQKSVFHTNIYICLESRIFILILSKCGRKIIFYVLKKLNELKRYEAGRNRKREQTVNQRKKNQNFGSFFIIFFLLSALSHSIHSYSSHWRIRRYRREYFLTTKKKRRRMKKTKKWTDKRKIVSKQKENQMNWTDYNFFIRSRSTYFFRVWMSGLWTAILHLNSV